MREFLRRDAVDLRILDCAENQIVADDVIFSIAGRLEARLTDAGFVFSIEFVFLAPFTNPRISHSDHLLSCEIFAGFDHAFETFRAIESPAGTVTNL